MQITIVLGKISKSDFIGGASDDSSFRGRNPLSSIFVSHRNVLHDNEWAERIHLDFDLQDGLHARDRREDEIYGVMNRAQIVIALISPDWLASDWSEAKRNDTDLTHTGNRRSEAFTLLRSRRYEGGFTQNGTDYVTTSEQRVRDQLENEKILREQPEKQADLAHAEPRRTPKNKPLGLAALSFNERQAGRPAEAVHLALAARPRQSDSGDNLSDYSMALTAFSKAGAAQREACRIAGHDASVHSVAFPSDETRTVSAGDDGTTRFWDVSYGPGTTFDIHFRCQPTRNPPAILETYRIELREPIGSGEEPLLLLFSKETSQ